MTYTSSYPSTSTLAPAYGNFATFSRVDVESLLWEMSHIVRGLTKVTRTQQAQLAQLREDDDSSAATDGLIDEYDERASAALRAVDTALDQMAADVLMQEDDAWYDVDRQGVAAWARQAHEELHRTDDDQSLQQQQPAEIPADFWETHDFNWDDEPEELEPAHVAPVPLFEEPAIEVPLDETADELVLPSDSVTSRGDSDSEYAEDCNDDEWEGYSDASFEAGEREHFAFHNDEEEQSPTTLYQQESAAEYPIDAAPASVAVPDSDSAMRALRRHGWLGGHTPAVATGFDSAAALLGKFFQQTTHASAMPLTAF